MLRPEPHQAAWRLAILLAVCVTFSLPCVQAASAEDVDIVGEQIVCYCGCPGLTVAACTCGTADQIREKIAGQLDSGLTTDQVVAVWVEERGEQILAVPTREGFNLVGWTMPFIAAILGLVAVTLAVLRWQRRSQQALPLGPGNDEDAAYLQRVTQDLEALRQQEKP